MVPLEEYTQLIASQMAHEAIAEMPNDDKVKWIALEDFEAQLAADCITKARIAKGLTQKQLAAKLKMPQSQISRIERNPDRTTVRTLKKIAKALGVDVSALIR